MSNIKSLLFSSRSFLKVGVLTGSLILLITSEAQSVYFKFGTYCQQSYEDNWQGTIDDAWERCSRFNDELAQTDVKVFYRNLHSARDEFETDNDDDGLERVSLAFVHTHGTYTSQNAEWTMWDKNVSARSTSMKLGNEDVKLSILASYACKTHYRADGNLWDRWSRIFKGGLRMSVGSHGYLWDGYTTDECGEDFADNIQGSMTIKNAWKSAVSDWKVDQDAMVFASGETTSQCRPRRDNMTWHNFPNYSRITDGDVHSICWVYWDNL
ncbi:MAG: DUF6345 domain-containing protein [Myxococcota bacterium]|nr:DUF6345 domain-containing protein [Myxococcota bacterium]